SAFAHAAGATPAKENRLLRRCGGDTQTIQYLINPNSRWKEYYAVYANNFLRDNPRFDGVFIDEMLGRLLVAGRFVRRITGEPRVVGEDGLTIKIGRAHV